MTTSYRFISLKQHKIIISQFSVGQESGHRLAECSALDLIRLKVRCQPGLQSHLRLGALFQTLLAEFIILQFD